MIKSLKDVDCIFCKIVEGKIHSKKIYETDNSLAFLDIFPINKGHTIIIPKNHYYTLEEIPENELTELFIAVKRIAISIRKKIKVGGYNILQNNFKAAGQVIEHIHIHIIPRNENDGKLKLIIPKIQASEESLNEVYNILKI